MSVCNLHVATVIRAEAVSHRHMRIKCADVGAWLQRKAVQTVMS